MAKKATKVDTDLEWIKTILIEMKESTIRFEEHNSKQHDELLVQTKLTNGRVTKLEQWKIDHCEERANTKLTGRDMKGYFIALISAIIGGAIVGIII